jgi:chemotaxis protein histidine kinase CheA
MDEQRPLDGSESTRIGADIVEALKASLLESDEAKRDASLVDILGDFARRAAASSGDPGASAQTAELAQRVRTLDEANAVLKDSLAAMQVDLENSNSQLESERERANTSERTLAAEVQRRKEVETQSNEFSVQLELKNREVYEAQVANDQILLKLQRIELAQSDTSKLDRAAEARRELSAEVETLRSEITSLRETKDLQIAQLNRAIAEGGTAPASQNGIDFDVLWLDLAQADPPLVVASDSPTLQAGQRAMQVLIELLRYVDDVDQLVRPFIGKYTRDNQAIQVPWDVYAKGDGMRTIVRTVLQPAAGKPAGVAKVRLRGLYSWLEAALIAADVTIESVASEFYAFAMGPGGATDDPTRKIKDFLRDDGHELFQQHMRLLCSRKLAEAFGHSR